MSLFTTGRNIFTTAWRQLRARTRLVASAFAPNLPPDNRLDNRLETTNTSEQQHDLLSGLNLAGQTVGLQVWDWDLVTNTLKFDRNVMDSYGGDVTEAEANPGEFISRAVHPEDIARYRREFVLALKGEAPLCIDYRVLHKDGTCYPMQLRGQVFRGPTANGRPSRATRVVGFTIDMRSQLDSAKRIEKQHEHQQQLIERLALAAEAAGIGVWDWDLKTDRLRSDSNMARIFDQADADSFPSAREFTAKIVHPEDFPAFYQAIETAVLQGDRVSHRYRHRHADGSLHHVQLHGRVIRDANKNPLRLLVITWDITREVEAQHKIEHQAKQLQQWVDRISLATETAGIGMWDWDLATGRLSSDTNMAGIFRDANLRGVVNAKDFVASILHPEDRIPFSATMLAATKRNGDNRVSTAFRYLRTDGGVHHVELHGRIVRNAAGIAERFLGISWNVTAKVEAQAEIERQSGVQRALLERLNLATEVAGIDVWDWNIESDSFTADTHMTKSYGTTHLEVASGRDLIRKIVHPDDIEKYMQSLDAAIATGQSLFHRYRMLLQDGTQRHVQAHGRVFRNADGKAVRMLGVSLDITEEVEHVNELRRQAEEERALRDRLNLATNTAGIAIWDQDMVSGGFTGDAHFWELFGREGPVAKFRVQDGIHPDVRQAALAPVYAAFADPSQDEVLSIRHRTNNPKRDLQYVQSHMRLFRSADGKPVRLLGVTWDVTDEMQANAALKDQANKERALVERLNVATQAAGISPWEFDLKSGQFSWHGQRPSCFGMDHVPLEDYYATIATIVLPEDRHFLSESGKEAIENNRDSYEYRFRVNGVDGKVHHIHNYARVMRSERGNIRYCVGVTWDVTEEVEAAEQLRSQAELERALVGRLNVATQAAGISPWEFDLKTDQFIWFGIRLSVLGLDDEPLDTYFAGLRRVVLEEDRHILVDAPLEALKTGVDVYSYRYRANGIDGQVHHLKNFVRVLRSPRGTPYRLVGVTWDISEEVAANELLQRQAEHERTLVARLNVATQAAGISPWEFDLKTNKYNWFGTRLKVLGLEDEPLDTYYDAIREILVPEDRNVLHDAALEAITKGIDMYSALYRANGIDGKIHYLKNFVRVLRSPRGTPYRLVGVTWDTSEEVAANELLQRQAEHARALTDRLNVATQAAGISPWEFDLVARKLTWLGIELKALGLGGVPLTDYLSELSKRIFPEDLPILTTAAEQAVAQGAEVFSYRFRANGIDGQVHHMKNYVRIQRNERGTPKKLLGVTWDISEEVTASVRLEEQAQHAHALKERLGIATMAAGISPFEIDLTNGKFLWVENPIKAMAGSRDSEGKLATFSQRIHPDDVNNFREEIVRASKGGYDVITYQYRGIAVDGGIVHVRTHAKLYFNEKRRALRALGVSWDITNEVAAAERLRHQTERLREVERRLERASLSSSEGHWEADVATGNLWCSSSFHALLGYLEGELETRVSAFDVLVHADDHAIYHEGLRSHLVHDTPYDVETRLRTASGEYRWFRMRGMAERNTEGQPTVMAGSIHDVHQQKLAEDALDMAQRRFERAINGTQDGLWELDVSNQTAWVSPRLALLLGFPIAELEARNFLRTLIHSDDAAKVSKVTESHYRHNTPFDLELRLQTRGGDHRWYRARASAERDSNGRAVRLSGSLQDVTEARIAREELVRATEAAEAASRAKSAFLANVSHEIRTPMNGIIGMTGLLIDTQLDRTQRDYANTIRGSADSLLTVINDILDFSKIEAGKLDLESIDMDLRANVEDVGAMMAFQAANKGLELIINVHPEVPERVLGDPQRIRQCLINLLGNAIKFTKHGEIVIDVCIVGSHEGKVLTHFEVRDTGMGIPDATLKTLFQPFVQADSSTTRHFGGTGLGLSIVRRLVEMMGGQVGVVSKVGEGSNFFFTLSLEPKEDSSITSVSRQASRNGQILIVDDNATNRRVLDGLLTHHGYRVTCADSGAAALEALRAASAQGGARKFDMVITDFQMPDMDGITLGERITNDPSQTHLRLIMLTSLDRQGDSKHLAALGFAAYLTKPVRTRELLDCVKHVLSGEARQWQMEMRPMLTRNSLAQTQSKTHFAGHVLLVEDNLVNQKVAARFLERMGCTVHIAGNGADGVAMFKERPFDAVLMDLQMPVMDGLTATRAIRELESGMPGRHVPIIALTANAMRGDKERCEAAGMDDFLTKPIEIERLRDTLAKFGLHADGKAAHSEAIAVQELLEHGTTTTPPPIDLARLNEITGGDPEFAKELIETFVASCAAQLVEIHDAIKVADYQSLARSAHKLKGACANIHAEEMRLLVARLESEALTTNAADLISCNAQLEQAFARAKEFLSDPSIIPANVKAAS